MNLAKHRWMALILGVAVFLGAFGIALAATFFQVSREVPSTVVPAQVLVDENLGVYHDPEGTDPVTSLEFVMLQPPLGPRIPPITVYIKNESDVNLTLVEPCREIFDEDSGQRIGFMNPLIESQVNLCDVPVTIPPGEMVAASVDIHLLEPGLQPGDYSFTTVFGAVGVGDGEPVSDADSDGYTEAQGDCDDTDPDVNPGAVEIQGNGIDDNCDGSVDEGGGGGAGLTDYDSFTAFNAATGTLTEIDFESLAPDGSSCGDIFFGTDPAFDNPLILEGVTFTEDTCLDTAFYGAGNDNLLILYPGSGLIELPAGSGGGLLVILGMGTASFEVLANDGAGDGLSINGQGQGYDPVYAGFTSDSDITTIEVVSTSGGPIVISSFFFEGSGEPVSDADDDGYTEAQGDCDDTDPDVNPGAVEIQGNGIDDNCDGSVDEGGGGGAGLTDYDSFTAFNAATGTLTEIDFESLAPDGSSCGDIFFGTDPAFDNPLILEGVTFTEDTCLDTAFYGAGNDNLLILYPGSGLIELPAGSGGGLLVILGMGTASFEVLANDGAGDGLSINGQGQGYDPVYAGFTSDSDITTIEVVSTSGGPIVISSFFFEG